MTSAATPQEIDQRPRRNRRDEVPRGEVVEVNHGAGDHDETHCYVVASTGKLDVRELRREHESVDALVPLFLDAPPTEWNALVLDNAATYSDAYRHPIFYATMAFGAIALLGLFWMLTPWFPWT